MKLHQNRAVLKVGLGLHQALLGFVALNPTYILAAFLQNTKPNNRRFWHQALKVSYSIRLAVFVTTGCARREAKIRQVTVHAESGSASDVVLVIVVENGLLKCSDKRIEDENEYDGCIMAGGVLPTS